MEKRKNSISVSESNPAIIKDNKKCVECGHFVRAQFALAELLLFSLYVIQSRDCFL